MSIWYAFKNISKTGIKPYSGACTPYTDLSGHIWYDTLTANIPAIQNTALQLLTQKDITMQQYYNTTLVDEGKWESKAFLVWNTVRKGGNNDLLNNFKDIPGLVSLSISILKPGTHIKPHNGDTDATYRLHIPVLIPTGLPECGIKVAGITKPWASNSVVCFCDAHLHEAWNYSDKTRIILIADVIRPEFIPQTRVICANVLSWLLLQKTMGIKPVKVLPGVVQLLIALIQFTFFFPLFILLQRWKK